MKIIVSDEALTWFEAEMEVDSGDAICFFARYGGTSPLHDGFSLGVMKVTPDEASIEALHDGVLYYIESRDEWFFDNHDLHVNVDPKLHELIYSYEKA